MGSRYAMSLFNEMEVGNEEADPLGSFSGERNGGADILLRDSFARTIYLKETGKRKNSGAIKASLNSLIFQKEFYADALRNDWDNWQWQIRNSIICFEQLKKIINFSEDEYQALLLHKDNLPLRITPYYASLIDRDNPEQPLRRSVVPVINEFSINPGEAEDPLGEDKQSPVPGLVHRYPDRVLFLTTGFCSTNCRYCTRSRMIGSPGQCHFNPANWDAAISYIESTPEIRDVLLSGGDPLTLQDEHLEYLISRLKNISHIEFIRIGTKAPVVLPQRITLSLVKMLKKYHPIWMNIHFTHPDEITPEVSEACNRLADAGIPLGSQTVLLKGINDTAETMKKLYHELIKVRVRPYYLYQCDPIIGSAHFRTPVKKGLEIIQALRGHTTGFAVPNFVIDAPGGGGKIPLLPEYCIGREGDDVLLKNYENKIFRYPDNSGKTY